MPDSTLIEICVSLTRLPYSNSSPFSNSIGSRSCTSNSSVSGVDTLVKGSDS